MTSYSPKASRLTWWALGSASLRCSVYWVQWWNWTSKCLDTRFLIWMNLRDNRPGTGSLWSSVWMWIYSELPHQPNQGHLGPLLNPYLLHFQPFLDLPHLHQEWFLFYLGIPVHWSVHPSFSPLWSPELKVWDTVMNQTCCSPYVFTKLVVGMMSDLTWMLTVRRHRANIVSTEGLPKVDSSFQV